MALNILVVDDEPKWLRVVSLYLSSRDYQVTTALNGEEALRKIEEDHPDLIVADIAMPVKNGFELCSQLRRDPKTRTIPFIFLTARDLDADKTKARKIGADDYLTKPCPLERLLQSIEAAMDRIEQARKLPLERIGQSGWIENVDLLDMIQTLELEQKTGALVLSHGERTATLFFREGAIVDANIRSPKREEPLFKLLGWKTGRFLFIPDAVPQAMQITASVANLLLEDLRVLEEHEQQVQSTAPSLEANVHGPLHADLAGQILARLEAVAKRCKTGQEAAAGPHTLRILVVGVARSGKSELIQGLVRDLAGSRWTAVDAEEPRANYRADVGRVRVSHKTALHLLAVRAEKRFWGVWEQCLPGAVGAILLVSPETESVRAHLQAFLKAKNTLAPNLPVQALMPVHGQAPEGKKPDVDLTTLATLPGLATSAWYPGAIQDKGVRLTVLDHLLQQSLAAV